ncbi:uncharacterized protein [Diadema antillarum]|uniref:uncharacterized protein n=1 Tax=Diadema antillarum TaxID=105358 RepID=UPI003A862AC1
MKTTYLVTLTFCCLFYQTIKAATISRDGRLTSSQIRELLDLYPSDELARLDTLEGSKRSGCSSFSGCMRLRLEQEAVAAMLRSRNAHLFGLEGVGKRKRSVDDAAADMNDANTE